MTPITKRNHNPAWKDTTSAERQRRRREREREWLQEHGFSSWEALHTKLMNGELAIIDKGPTKRGPVDKTKIS